MAGRYVLVVEDEELIQLLLATYLEQLGFEVSLAGSAAEAKDQIRMLGSVVAGAVIDMSLPDGQGNVLLRDLRRLHPLLPAVICSGYERARFEAGLAGEPSLQYLQKPFSREQLEEALRSASINP